MGNFKKMNLKVCSICFVSVGEDVNFSENLIYKSPCGHEFHKKCIKLWRVNKATCPTCRAYIPPIN